MNDLFAFAIDQRVTVKELPSVSGPVRGIWVDGNGVQFQVQSLDHTGRVQRDWFLANELNAA